MDEDWKRRKVTASLTVIVLSIIAGVLLGQDAAQRVGIAIALVVLAPDITK